MINDKDITTEADQWGFRTGTRFVGPQEWLHGLPQEWAADELHMTAYVEAMAAAAADDGTIIGFSGHEWYEGPLSDVLRDEHDDPAWKLKYDRFAAMVLLDIEMRLMEAGYLAGRGNGDSTDRRLTLPATA